MISLTILTPLVAALIILVLRQPGNDSRLRNRNAWIALAATATSLVSASLLLRRFATNYAEAQLNEVWWQGNGGGFGLNFALDSLSLPLFLTTSLLFFVAALFSLNKHSLTATTAGEKTQDKLFWAMILMLEGIVLGVFSAHNFVVFFAFWELFLIPLVILMWRYGLEERRKAALSFFIYTFASSAFMIAAFIAIIYYVPRVGVDFEMRTIFINEMTGMPAERQKILFVFFMIAFLVKMPVFPFHAWLPLTHTQAPIGTLLLSGLFLKLGSYGVLRFVAPNFTSVLVEFGSVFLWLGIVSMLYGAFAAYRQKSFRYVIAYSSLAHMGLILSGALSRQESAVAGAIIQNVGHSLANALLFLVVCLHLARNKSDALNEINPPSGFVYWLAFSIAMFSAIGVPGTVGFLGEVMILYGLSFQSWWITFFAVTTLVLSAAYMLRLFHKVRSRQIDNSWRVAWNEKLSMVILSVAILWFGIAPSFLGKTAQTAAKSISHGVAGVAR